MLTPSFTDMARKTPTATKRPTGQVTLRVDPDLEASLQDGERVLGLLAKSNGEDAPDSSKSMRRFLRLGLDLIFNRVGGRPQTEADWAALEASLLAPKKH